MPELHCIYISLPIVFSPFYSDMYKVNRLQYRPTVFIQDKCNKLAYRLELGQDTDLP